MLGSKEMFAQTALKLYVDYVDQDLTVDPEL